MRSGLKSVARTMTPPRADRSSAVAPPSASDPDLADGFVGPARRRRRPAAASPRGSRRSRFRRSPDRRCRSSRRRRWRRRRSRSSAAAAARPSTVALAARSRPPAMTTGDDDLRRRQVRGRPARPELGDTAADRDGVPDEDRPVKPCEDEDAFGGGVVRVTAARPGCRSRCRRAAVTSPGTPETIARRTARRGPHPGSRGCAPGAAPS